MSQDACAEATLRYNSTWIDPASRPTVTNVLLGLYIFSMILVVASFVVMRILWDRFERLRARGFAFFFVTTLGILVFLQSGPLQDIIGKQRVPCTWNLISSNLVIPLFGSALIGRLFDSMNKTKLARVMMNVPLDQADRIKEALSSSSLNIDSLDPTRLCWGFRRGEGAVQSASTADKPRSFSAPFNSISRESAERGGSEASVRSSPETPATTKYVTEKEFNFWMRIASRPGRILTIILIVFPFVLASLILIATEPEFYIHGCYGCAFSRGGLLVLVFTGIAIVFFGLVVSFRIHSFPDPYGIVRECQWGFLMGGLPAIIFFALDKWEPVYRGHPDFSWIIPEVVGVVVMFIIHGPLQLIIAIVEDNKDRAHRSEVTRRNSNENRTPELEDILEDPAGTEAFEAFLVSMWASESLRFYIEAREWTTEFHDMGQRTALSRARRIIRVFIDINGSMTVNLDHEIVGNLQTVLTSSEPVSQDLFRPAIKEVVKLMRCDNFFRFKESQAYKDFAETWKAKSSPRFSTRLDPIRQGSFERPAEVEVIMLT